MKICEKKSLTSKSLYVVLPKDQIKLVGLKKGDDVTVIANNKKELVIKKVKGE